MIQPAPDPPRAIAFAAAELRQALAHPAAAEIVRAALPEVSEAFLRHAARRAIVPGELQILHVEDDAQIRHLLTEASDVLGVRLAQVSSLNEARRRLEAGERYDAILLDLNLPDSGGVATFLRVSRAAPETPVVVLTGDDPSGLQAAGAFVLEKGLTSLEAIAGAIAEAVLTRQGDSGSFRVRRPTA